MKELQEQIDYYFKQTKQNPNIIESLYQEDSIFPFSPEGRALAYLLANRIISYEKYNELISEYSKRNKYLELFEIAPRTFGETWGETHIRTLFPQFLKATKANMSTLYPDFDGEFDLWLDGVRVEVKACRANSTKSKGSLASKAFLHKDASAAFFKYHFQQLKPSCCDVFIWIGVCRDELIYWVLSSNELLTTGKLGPQHRNQNTGIANTSVFEGQVFMTEEELETFKVPVKCILNAVLLKGKK